MTTIEQILAAIRTLPTEDRGRLIPLIWDQVPPEDWPNPSSECIAEANRRSDLIDEGGMVAEDWNVVRERARRTAGLSE
ncbi:MAG: addiction module protein [Planctomycetaceae bacterium]|jgi:Putative addiction module component